MPPSEFYDMLEKLDWNDKDAVKEAELIGKKSLENKILFYTYRAHVIDGIKKPVRPNL